MVCNSVKEQKDNNNITALTGLRISAHESPIDYQENSYNKDAILGACFEVLLLKKNNVKLLKYESSEIGL